MRKNFHVTYEIVTPESAELGDATERGFIGPMGLEFDTTGLWSNAAGKVKADCAMGLREAFNHMSTVEDSGHWFSECDGRQNYQTGAETRYSFHPPAGITGASYARLQKLFGLAA